MPWPRMLVGLYGIFNIAVGLQAYLKTGSVASVAGGAGIGILLLICFALVPTKPRLAYIGASVLCLAIMGQFGRKLAVLWPNQVLFGTALIVFLALGAAHFMAQKKAGPA